MNKHQKIFLTLTKEEFMQLYKMMRWADKCRPIPIPINRLDNHMNLWNKVNDCAISSLTYDEIKEIAESFYA